MSYQIVAPKRAVIKGSDPMPAIRKAAMDTVNGLFNHLAHEHLHRDHAHASKRSIAGLVVAGGAPTPEFMAEATARGGTPTDLALLILSKPDKHASRELSRQKIMLKIEQAVTPAEVDGIIANVEI